ncbi:MAG: glycosyltransferase family 4 protein [Syntrophales bacterium]|nr:glycosyltransferase family 4 protein [Syntrophales bacterium]MCK9528255.1 glycosyltransferase family 4 protein [Syntrophales bacterium]MDX9922386.1 glycosyltransferase family 4 protein [Syntrophales bacterium]
MKDSLSICLLTYRGNPTSGGQGVYIRYLGRALRDLGHRVTVISGPPYPELDDGVILEKLPGLDLYNPDHLFKPEKPSDLLVPINQLEFLIMSLGGFPEPLTFGWRVFHYFRIKKPRFDVVHDNQCLSYGILGLPLLGYPTLATIHHPITVDRDMELRAAFSRFKKFKIRRWYSFLKMQKRVARRLEPIITVSECSKWDISRDFRAASGRFRVVPNGINTDFFYPLPKIRRAGNSILVTNSADTPLKGLRYLLEALASIRKHRKVKLTVVGKPKKNGTIERMVQDLSLCDCVTFTGRIKYEEFAGYYAKATMAVIPSLYEGFGMPAGEAMACGVPIISTTGGALPEVVGDAGILVPPGDSAALERAIVDLLDNPGKRRKLGKAGLQRVRDSFTWRHAALKTTDIYREAIDAHG